VPAALGFAAVLVALAWEAWRESRRETARLNRRMYDGRRRLVGDQIAQARLDYYAHTATPGEIRAAVTLWESDDLDAAARRVDDELARYAAEETARRQHPAGWFDADPEETR